ncbi:putative nuclease HARBI1 isoform X2 [Anthonomus grandis grandis]|uniref:putative nuclease HARBI1 isoform X2 n=1 Tax=Anthonomus grandis grandis TaxID=2921223 RepID=UPI0021655982|nr:putative nuclease HARBI1 isoform X2 [Anthonomus grandis grandis]
MRDMSDPFALPDRRFSELFGLNKDLVTYLFNNLVPHLEQEQRQTRVPRETRILIALRFFATGNYQRGVGEEFILSSSQQVVSRCIEEVAQCVSNHLEPLWVKFPTGNETRNQVKASFMEKADFPDITDCIDCTHIAVLAPSEEEHNYVNRKGFHSNNVQIICDSDLQITNINPRYPGSTNDAFIWRPSQVKDLTGS